MDPITIHPFTSVPGHPRSFVAFFLKPPNHQLFGPPQRKCPTRCGTCSPCFGRNCLEHIAKLRSPGFLYHFLFRWNYWSIHFQHKKMLMDAGCGDFMRFWDFGEIFVYICASFIHLFLVIQVFHLGKLWNFEQSYEVIICAQMILFNAGFHGNKGGSHIPMLNYNSWGNVTQHHCNSRF